VLGHQVGTPNIYHACASNLLHQSIKLILYITSCDRMFPSGITYACGRYGTCTVEMNYIFVELATFLVRNSN